VSSGALENVLATQTGAGAGASNSNVNPNSNAGTNATGNNKNNHLQILEHIEKYRKMLQAKRQE